ncbi:MAG: BRCT domain-containing protein, partial [Clostridia bacterium]
VDRGGICGDHVTKKTNYLVVGNFDMRDSIKNGRSVKMKKADELHAQGLDVNVISENVFYDMLDF